MCFNRDQLLVFGLGAAATAALSYKFTKHLLGRQKVSTNQCHTVWRDSGCLLQDGLPVTKGISKPTMTNFAGQTPQQWMSGDAMNNNHKASTLSVGYQIGTGLTKVVDSGAQTDVIQDSPKSDENVVALNLKLNHTNVFMLRKQFEESLSKDLIGKLDVAFYKSKQLGNYIIIEADNMFDLKVSASFCEANYQGEMIVRSMLPWKLFFENSVSSFKVLGKKDRE